MASLVAAYAVDSGGNNSNVLTTPSFTPANGDILVVHSMSWFTGNIPGAISGGGQTYTQPKTVDIGGFTGYCRIDTAKITGSPGAMTVSQAAPSTSCRHFMVVQHWTAADLAPVPATNATVNNASSAPAAVINTVADNSALSFCIVDENSLDPATAAYRLNGIQSGIYDGHVGSNSVMYSAYAVGPSDVGVAGAYTIGMTAPAPQNWVMAGIEILDLSGVTVTGSIQFDLGALDLQVEGERTTFGSVMINLGALELELSSITGGSMADDFYAPGPCRPYEYVSMCTLPIEAVGVTGYALQAASEIVYYATAQRFDTCQVSLRPCRRVCSDWTWGGVINGWSEWGYWGGGPMPALIKGQWYNITCGACGDTCSCTPLSEVWLPGPVREIVQVVVDGVVLTPDVDYRLDDYRKLVRLGGLDWPWCNDLNKGITEAGTWSVTAFFGLPLPTLGKLAVGELLCEITTDILGGDCNLPPGVTDLTRQGVTMTFETVQEALESGFYGLKYVDRFIKTYNPNQLQARPFTYDLDAPTSRVTGTVIT